MRREQAHLKGRGRGSNRTKEALSEALSLLTATIEATADGILVVDNEGTVSIYNKKFLSMWNIPESLASKRDCKKMLDHVMNRLKDPRAFLEGIRQMQSRPEAETYDVLEFRDGRVFERFSQPHRLGEEVVGRVLSFRDITDRRRAERESDRRSRQLTLLHRTSVEMTAELNLKVLFQSIAQRSLNLIGGQYCNCYLYQPELKLIERVAQAGQELFSTGDTRKPGEGFVGHIWATGAPLLVDDYHAWPGRKREYDCFPSRTLVGVPIRWREEFLGVLSVMAFLPHSYTQADMEMLDMFATQAAIAIRNARLYKRIEQIAITDDLTGLFNRRGFFQLGEREVERTLRFNRPLTALMLDIDHFKMVNDTYTHACGDHVLRAVADCLRQNTRGIDLVGRYGGEEFALLMPEAFLPEATQLAERVRQAVDALSVPISATQEDFPPFKIDDLVKSQSSVTP
ncbi:MAG: diguanylate cyclase [Smithellaceae bacterium]|nr:diguanylate cyclase [Smithellaceae bacterium]